MGSLKRFTRYVKDFWKVVIRGENDDLQRQTLSMEEKLGRLRNRRMTSDKQLEAAALNQARGAVQRMRELHNSLLAAEEAASEFGAKMGEAARSSIEAHAETREQAYKKFFVKQKELYQQEIKPDLQGETGLPVSELPSQSNGHDEASKAPVLKFSGPADGKETSFAAMGGNMGGNMPNEAGESQICPAVVQGTVEIIGEEVRQTIVSAIPEDMTSSSSSNKNAAVDKMDYTQEIPGDILAQMMQEVRKQVRLEEKSHLDALARDRAILEKKIEAQENAECGSISQGHQ